MLTSTDYIEQPNHSQILFRDACRIVELFFIKQFPAKLIMLWVLQFALAKTPGERVY
jgi:hypothetical protein